MKCTNCKQSIVQKTADGVRIRSDGPMSVDAAGEVHARCYWCKGDIVLPLELKKSLVEERFIILPTPKGQ